MEEESKTYAVGMIIPTLNAQDDIARLLETLLAQTHRLDEILVIDSSSDDATTSIVSSFDAVRVVEIERAEFNHGLTRDMGMRELSTDFVLYMTQDALPASNRYVENLIAPMVRSSSVAMSTGRQLPKEGAWRYEQLVREHNYPAISSVRSIEDVERLGIKAFFVSDACAAYRRSSYLECGGFDAVNTNEDMLMAAKLMQRGYQVAYAADAEVYHSHNLSFRDQYKRNYAIGAFLESHKGELLDAPAGGSGANLVKSVMRTLWEEKDVSQMFAFARDCVARAAGNYMGKRSVAWATKSQG